MYGSIKSYVERYSGEKKIFKLLSEVYPSNRKEYRLCKKAYTLVRDEYISNTRDTGDRYIEHFESTFVITHRDQSMFGIYDANPLAAALLHDMIEDKSWTRDSLAREFNPRVADLVQSVSKAPLLKFGNNVMKRDSAYRQQLLDSGLDSIRIKLSDQIDNLLTLWGKPTGEQPNKIILAYQFYFPLALSRNILVLPLKEAMEIAQVKYGFKANDEFFRKSFFL